MFDWSDATRLDLDVIRDSFESAPNTLSDNVWGWIVGDRPKGFQTTEKMLLNGTPLTAIGELAISKDNSGIKMQAPSTGENYYLVKVCSFIAQSFKRMFAIFKKTNLYQTTHNNQISFLYSRIPPRH